MKNVEFIDLLEEELKRKRVPSNFKLEFLILGKNGEDILQSTVSSQEYTPVAEKFMSFYNEFFEEDFVKFYVNLLDEKGLLRGELFCLCD